MSIIYSQISVSKPKFHILNLEETTIPGLKKSLFLPWISKNCQEIS